MYEILEPILYFIIGIFIILLVAPIIGVGLLLARDFATKNFFAFKRKTKRAIKTPVKAKPKAKKVTLFTKLNKSQKHWFRLVDMRANALDFKFLKKHHTPITYGNEHYIEYKANELEVPEDKREKVAFDRVEGLASIQNYINNNGSEKQKFHFLASWYGAIFYASSIGINVDKYQDLIDGTEQ